MRGPRTWDVIVVGAGPAGAVVALCAARAGAETLLVERKRFPRPKVCGGCLNAPAVALLESLGLGDVLASHGRPIERLCVGLGRKQVTLTLPGGIVIPRARLDAALVRHACESGAVFLPETTASLGAEQPASRAVRLDSRDFTDVACGRAVVLATGLGRSTDEFTTRVARGARLGTGCLVASGPAAYAERAITMAVARSGYVGVTRGVDGLVIASALDAAFLRVRGGPARAAAAILDEAGFPPIPTMLEAEWSGTLPMTRSTRPLASGRVFLVGDAAGYVEPFTGQGMALAVQGANALWPHVARAVRAWSPALAADWSRDYRRNVTARSWPATLIAAIARRPGAAALAVRLAEVLPTLPDVLVRVVNHPVVSHPKF
jgi:flavin-dependent dehydrogenase